MTARRSGQVAERRRLPCCSIASLLLQGAGGRRLRSGSATTLGRMDGARIRRLRWRLRGAWLWPTFVVLIVVDTLIGHELPPQGDGQSAASAMLVAMLAMLLGIILLAPALALLMRRRGSDMPVVVARDYAGTVVVLLISGALLRRWSRAPRSRRRRLAPPSPMRSLARTCGSTIGRRRGSRMHRRRGHVCHPAGKCLPDVRARPGATPTCLRRRHARCPPVAGRRPGRLGAELGARLGDGMSGIVGLLAGPERRCRSGVRSSRASSEARSCSSTRPRSPSRFPRSVPGSRVTSPTSSGSSRRIC